MKNFSKVWDYYSRKDVQEALIEVAKDREIVGVFSNGNFGKRPNVLMYPNDIQLDKIRIGWDLIIDPDCPDFEIAKLTTRVILKTLDDHGIKNYSLKLTGGKSFHIGLPFGVFPEKINFQETNKLYPELPQKIIEYLKDYIKEQLKEEILALDNPLSIEERFEKYIAEITDKDGLDPLKVVQIDSMLVSSRHMFRLPFSLHEKSLLVSLPIDSSQLEKVKKEDAEPSKVKIDTKFLERKSSLKEANTLVIEAMGWSSRHKIVEERVPYKGPKRKIKEFNENFFPPCILKILNGMSDGRKRSVFILNNFLRNMGWTPDKIEKKLIEWNKKNKPPLPERYIRTQYRWHNRQKRNILPPNCEHQNFYVSMGVHLPDEVCKGWTKEVTLKNPVNYPFRKIKKR